MCDREFGCAQRAAKKKAVISDLDDWIEVYKTCNRKHPFNVHKMKQSEFRNWHEYLKQFYIKSRKDSDGLKVAFQGAHWRNYGYGPEMGHDGVVTLVHHPGEIWFKYNLDVSTPWVKVDVRRNSKKGTQFMRKVGDDDVRTNILTCDLPDLNCDPTDIEDPVFDLYDGPIPISKAKYDDLNSLCPYLPEHKRQQYIDLKYDQTIIDSEEDENDILTDGDDQ